MSKIDFAGVPIGTRGVVTLHAPMCEALEREVIYRGMERAGRFRIPRLESVETGQELHGWAVESIIRWNPKGGGES